MRVRHLVFISLAVLIVFVTFRAVTPTHAAGTVGTGTAESCTEAALDAALVGGGAVTFNCGKSPAVISIANEKVIEQNITIDGNGLITLSGRNVTRLFKVNSGITFEVRKLIIAHGAANDNSETARDGMGGGILNDGGNVTLIDVMIRSGRADRSGGGIYNRGGSLTLIRATLSDNYVADNGSGLLNEKGQVLIANSTFSGNFAGKNGGGLFNFEGAITIINSTFYNNIAGFNGAGILNNAEGTVAIKNSIIANAPSGNNPITGNCGGTITDGNKNLQFPDDSCGKTIPVSDPQLGTLADNGGFVLTHAIKEGSPALNKADNTVCLSDPVSKVDERNIARPFGDACDIGAYEFDPKSPANGFGQGTTAAGGDCQCQQPQATGTGPACVQQGTKCSPNGPACCPGLTCKNASAIAVAYACLP